MITIETTTQPALEIPSQATETQRWHWEITPHLANVAVARHLVEEAASTILPEEARFDLVVATSEVVTNSIKAAVANGLTQPVVLELGRDGDAVTLTCLDYNGQTPQARRIPPVQHLHYHTCRIGRWHKREWKRWQRRQSLGKGIPLADRLSRNHGGDGFVLVRDGAQVRASLTMHIGARPATAGLAAMFAADIAVLSVA